MSSVWGQLLDQILFVKGMYYGSFHDKYKATLLPGLAILERFPWTESGVGTCAFYNYSYISANTHILHSHISPIKNIIS